MATVKVNDIEIDYELRGRGFPLVMIMGYAGNKQWWPPELVEPLANHYRLLLFDNRGTGKTASNGWCQSIPLMAKDTLGLMDALGIQQAHILGVSMGGMIAQEIALNDPKRVRRLVLGCTACGFWSGATVSANLFKLWLDYLTRADVRNRRFLTNLFFSQAFLTQNPEKFERFSNRARQIPTSAETKQKQIAAMWCFDSYWRLRFIRASSLVMTGSEDCMVPPRNSEILVNRIPKSHLKTMHGCGHGFFIEAAEAVADELIQFLTN